MNLYIVMSHLDDFELSCLGFLFKHKKRYNKIKLIVASKNKYKEKITNENILELEKYLNCKIEYIQLGFDSKYLLSNIDKIKNDLYSKHINWNEKFDILTHDSKDLHTDHQSINNIMQGVYKYADRFVTVYSPSSLNFSPNYFVDIPQDFFDFKKSLIEKYDIKKDDSFSKKGYYFEDHWNMGYFYAMENKIDYKSNFYEVYLIKKWS